MNVFIDSGPLRALVSPHDQWRKKTLEILEQLSQTSISYVTTDYVLSEVFTGLLGEKRLGYIKITKFNDLIFVKRFTRIEWVTQERFLKTKALLLKVSKDKQWSFTDCTSYVIMKELKIKTIFTFDTHFKQMGFTLLE